MSPRRPSTLSPGRVMVSVNEAAALLQAGTLLASGLADFFKGRHPELNLDPLPALDATARARAEALEREGRRCGWTNEGRRCSLETGHVGIHR